MIARFGVVGLTTVAAILAGCGPKVARDERVNLVLTGISHGSVHATVVADGVVIFGPNAVIKGNECKVITLNDGAHIRQCPGQHAIAYTLYRPLSCHGAGNVSVKVLAGHETLFEDNTRAVPKGCCVTHGFDYLIVGHGMSCKHYVKCHEQAKECHEHAFKSHACEHGFKPHEGHGEWREHGMKGGKCEHERGWNMHNRGGHAQGGCMKEREGGREHEGCWKHHEAEEREHGRYMKPEKKGEHDRGPYMKWDRRTGEREEEED